MKKQKSTVRETLIDLAVVMGITVGAVIVLGLILGLHTITDLFFLAFGIHIWITGYTMFTGWRIRLPKRSEKEATPDSDTSIDIRNILDFRETDLRVVLYGTAAIINLALSLMTEKLGR